MVEHEPPVPGPFLPSHLGVELHVCSPPYHRLDRIPRGGRPGPPLGSVVYAMGRGVMAVLEQLNAAIREWPWVAPCAGLPSTEYVTEKYSSLERLLRARLAVVPPGQPVNCLAVARAVAARPQPNAGSLAGWICSRLGAGDLAAPLIEQFQRALGGREALPRSVASYSRLFGRYGNLKAKDWRAIARLLVLHHVTVQKHLVGRVVSGEGFDLVPSTAGRYSVKYLGKTWTSALQHVGWEWVLECALRKYSLPTGS
jgi:hypothetical protein